MPAVVAQFVAIEGQLSTSHGSAEVGSGRGFCCEREFAFQMLVVVLVVPAPPFTSALTKR